jgi:hypothetical protein
MTKTTGSLKAIRSDVTVMRELLYRVACLCESMHKSADWSVGRPVRCGKRSGPMRRPLPRFLPLEA